MLIRQKKGFEQLGDVFYVIAFLMATAILIFILYYAFNQAKTPLATALSGAVPAGETSFNVTKATNQTLGGVSMFNTLFPFLLFGLIAMTVVSAFFLDSHPIFFVVSLIILLVVILLSVVFSNIYQTITEDAAFGDTENNFTIMNIFMKKLPWIALIVMAITAIILLGKSQGGGGSGL